MAETQSLRSSDDEGLGKESLELLASDFRSWRLASTQHAHSKKLLLVNIFLFCCSLTTLFVALFAFRSPNRSSDQQEISWSPILDAVPVRTEKYNETFGFPSTYPSKFRGGPNNEVDREWERFTKHPLLDGRSGRLGVSHSEISRLPKATDPEWLASVVRLGEDKYMANLEIFHTSHCLNMLRKMVYPEYYGSYDLAERGHLEHCVETIRQALMCNSGTGLVTFHWVQGMQEPYSDYNTYHQCRDADAVLDWAVRNAVLVPAEGVKRYEQAQEMHAHPE